MCDSGAVSSSVCGPNAVSSSVCGPSADVSFRVSFYRGTSRGFVVGG